MITRCNHDPRFSPCEKCLLMNQQEAAAKESLEADIEIKLLKKTVKALAYLKKMLLLLLLKTED